MSEKCERCVRGECFSYLKAAAKIAKAEGLSYEFREYYYAFRAQGDNPNRAAWRALYEWDMAS